MRSPRQYKFFANLPQACTADGTVYDIVNIVTYIQKFKRHPISGESLALKNVISLNFAKNGEGQYHCPVLHKVGSSVPFQPHEMHGRRQARLAALVVKDAGTGSRGAGIEGALAACWAVRCFDVSCIVLLVLAV